MIWICSQDSDSQPVSGQEFFCDLQQGPSRTASRGNLIYDLCGLPSIALRWSRRSLDNMISAWSTVCMQPST